LGSLRRLALNLALTVLVLALAALALTLALTMLVLALAALALTLYWAASTSKISSVKILRWKK
jgi:hypothetical protein